MMNMGLNNQKARCLAYSECHFKDGLLVVVGFVARIGVRAIDHFPSLFKYKVLISA